MSATCKINDLGVFRRDRRLRLVTRIAAAAAVVVVLISAFRGRRVQNKKTRVAETRQTTPTAHQSA